jgi:hypothetical protein
MADVLIEETEEQKNLCESIPILRTKNGLILTFMCRHRTCKMIQIADKKNATGQTTKTSRIIHIKEYAKSPMVLILWSLFYRTRKG